LVEWRARSYTRAPRTGASPADYSTTSPAIKTCRTPPSARCRASSRPPRDARGRNGYPRRELIRDGHMARAQRLGVCDLPLASSSRGRTGPGSVDVDMVPSRGRRWRASYSQKTWCRGGAVRGSSIVTKRRCSAVSVPNASSFSSSPLPLRSLAGLKEVRRAYRRVRVRVPCMTPLRVQQMPCAVALFIRAPDWFGQKLNPHHHY
jgi:hypothetical protein